MDSDYLFGNCFRRTPAPTGLTPNCIRVLVERDSVSGSRFSCSKQSGESPRCKFSVAHRVRDVLVPEIVLDQSGVCALVSERISASVPKHVRVDFQIPEPGCRGVFFDEYADRESGEWFATF